MINLIPEGIRATNRYSARNVRLLRYTVVSLVTMLVIIAITGLTILSMNRTESDLQKQSQQDNNRIASFKSLQAQGQQLSDQIATINSLLARQVNFSSVLPQIAQIMPAGAVLQELDLSTSDIVPSSGTGAIQKPFVIQAAVKDRGIAAVLLENIRSSKNLFTDADIVSVTQSTSSSTNANSLPTVSQRYPYQVIINAYLKKVTTSTLTTTSKAGSS